MWSPLDGWRKSNTCSDSNLSLKQNLFLKYLKVFILKDIYIYHFHPNHQRGCSKNHNSQTNLVKFDVLFVFKRNCLFLLCIIRFQEELVALLCDLVETVIHHVFGKEPKKQKAFFIYIYFMFLTKTGCTVLRSAQDSDPPWPQNRCSLQEQKAFPKTK